MFGIGGMVNCIFMLGNMCYGKYWEIIDFIIVIGVVVIWFFWCSFVLFDIFF